MCPLIKLQSTSQVTVEENHQCVMRLKYRIIIYFKHIIHTVVITSKEPVCPRVELILKIIIIFLIIFLGFIKSKPC